ncbi:MAG: Asp-tRNA(Asn)/Glu-tRNA(Gln) amidotransferase subunit GatA [Vicinamibacterales bacterium]|jgi:aspartyl-tRNA(Asn)/glutamyl-tRNA(Gln) amidotransferase subunit A|nr:Asp-tRNA(Asn)/Glu-tRNA(Gln) amidotransferase GatCAB subunit A [Acidobacteriota bacterium]MDP7472889.1 Asp-tRNA(Asn)/Glu-tRNA(Gln) amidotransferase subunit GatA [Vicinamibacterales bacterium]MDP7671048.1 Asp-tRNA(Asn)/Glu-tRNA(Gln) amidotransferase subunit GatA [Vicinamibacterales bacterium]HJO38708.1 Asp-tRNA(Asn)/Glu-tRNA(Gln) amidotransferase subunit GatA [Vicinamibacterales bacterium]
MTISTRTLVEVRDAVADGAATAVDVCTDYLDRIAATDPSLHAFNRVTRERALERAAMLDRSRVADDHRPLLGVPIAVKDNLCTRGVATTASSRALDGFVPPYDATVIARLEDAGAVVVGKTNCDEFAMGSSTENSAFGPTHNPWDLARSPGGSSGGSAAAVSARLVPGALGSDTGGSIRQPAALCGVVGLKPTYGRVSRYGLLAFASSLDQIGPLTLTVRDAALLLEVIAGADPCDATAAPNAVATYADGLDGDLRGIRLGVPSGLLEDGVDADVGRVFDEAVAAFRAAGATIADVALPHASYAIPVYYLIATAEASSNLARYDGVRYGHRASLDPATATLTAMYDRTRSEGFGAEVKRRIMLGTYALSAGYYDAHYLKAQQVRTLIRQDYEAALESVDAVLMPTSPVPAFALGDKVDDPLQMYLLDVFTVSANLAGLPAMSVPAGFTPGRLPVGAQLVGRAFDEAGLLRIADGYERANGWWRESPTL